MGPLLATPDWAIIQRQLLTPRLTVILCGGSLLVGVLSDLPPWADSFFGHQRDQCQCDPLPFRSTAPHWNAWRLPTFLDNSSVRHVHVLLLP